MDLVDPISEEFFHQSNFNMLLGVLDADIQKRFHISVVQEYEPTRGILFETMVRVFDSCAEEDKKLNTLNKTTLMSCIPDVVKKAFSPQDSLGFVIEEDPHAGSHRNVEQYQIKEPQNPHQNPQNQKDDILDGGVPGEVQLEETTGTTGTTGTTVMQTDLANLGMQDVDQAQEPMATPINQLQTVDGIAPDAYGDFFYKPKLSGTEYTPEKTQEQKQILVNQHTDTYYDKKTAIEINSRDRDTISITNDNNAYSFTAKIGNKELRNIIHISLNHVIIPNVNNNISRFPYLYFRVKEFPGQFVGTSEHGSSAFAKIVRDKDWAETSQSNIVFFCMYDKFSKGWEPTTPLASLSKISIEILTPRGTPIEALQDTFKINKIAVGTSTWTVSTPSYFTNDFFDQHNIVTFHDLDPMGIPGEFYEYITRNEGHQVSESVTSTTQSLTFDLPETFDISTGNTSTNYLSSSPSSSYPITRGLIMNSSKQSSVCFHTVVREYKREKESTIV